MGEFQRLQHSTSYHASRSRDHQSRHPHPPPVLDGDLIANVISMNFSGRFTGQEVKDVGLAVIKHIVSSKKVSLFFGQQSNFRMTSYPDNFDIVGVQRTFILYNRNHLQANDENQYKHFLRDLELRGRLPKYYLPEANYTMCKMKCKQMTDMSFIAMSWVTDESKDTLKCLNLLRKLLSFTANLCAIEEMPIIIAGSFRLSLDQIKDVVYNEFEGFRCYGYKTDHPRRAQRMCDLFISCPPIKLEGVKPLVCAKMDVGPPSFGPGAGRSMSADRSVHRRNPEDAFYWDPVFAHILRRSGTSMIMSPTSPRALSPPSVDDEYDPQPTLEPWRVAQPAADTIHRGLTTPSGGGAPPLISGNTGPHSPQAYQPFETAEDTLRALLLESERIKQLVSDAELKARARLLGGSPRRPAVPLDPTKKTAGPEDTENVGAQVKDVDQRASRPPLAPKESQRLAPLNGATKYDAEEVEFRRLERAIVGGERIIEGGPSEDATAKVTSGSSTSSGGGTKNVQVAAGAAEGLKAPASPLRKTPSYVDLYDEELIETNRLCYMQ